MWSRIHLIPVLQAEEDRDLVRRHLAEKARERELLGAETKVYNNDRYVRDESGSIHMSGAGLIIIGSCGLRTRSHRATPQSKSTLYANRKACTYWGVQGVRVVGTPTKDKSFNKIQRLSPFDRNTVEFAPVSTRSFTLALSQPLGYPLCRDQDHQELHPPKACLAASQFPPGGSNLD